MGPLGFSLIHEFVYEVGCEISKVKRTVLGNSEDNRHGVGGTKSRVPPSPTLAGEQAERGPEAQEIWDLFSALLWTC